MYQPSNITPPEQIHDELLEYQSYLELPCATDNGNAVVERMDKLAGYMARSGKLQADAEYHYYKVIDSEIFQALKDLIADKLPKSTVNSYVEAKSKDYKHLHKWAERVNRSITHQYEGLRSVLSSLKAEKYSSGRF